MKTKNLILFLSVMLLLYACTGGAGTGSTGGIDIKFTEVPEKEVYEGEEIFATILITNSLVNEGGIQGILCLRDTLSDNYGGIPDNACADVNLPPATRTDGGVSPYVMEINFPEVSPISPYRGIEREISKSYQNLPIIADFKYSVETTAGAVVCIKLPGAVSPNIPKDCGTKQTLSVQQPSMPLKISKLTVTPSRRGSNNVLLNIEMTISKSKQGLLLSSGEISGGVPAVASVSLDVLANQDSAGCQQVSNGRISIRSNENEKVIKCALSINDLSQDYINVPITVRMKYGFAESVVGTTISILKGDELVV